MESVSYVFLKWYPSPQPKYVNMAYFQSKVELLPKAHGFSVRFGLKHTLREVWLRASCDLG